MKLYFGTGFATQSKLNGLLHSHCILKSRVTKYLSLSEQLSMMCMGREVIIVYPFSSPAIGTPCLPALVSYLNHLPSIALVPVPITKAVWFVFAVST